jgi:anoctamin-8
LIQEEYPGTFDEYIELIIQFGHLALFGFCWPLAPLLAVLNNLIEV